jgi:[ribosomal protein S5]-alanine N-acetyltransferase
MHTAISLRVLIRPPTLTDEAEFLAAALRSRALHQPWTHVPRFPSEFRVWFTRMQPPANHAYLVCRHDTQAIVGVITLSKIVLGLLGRGGQLGYYVFAGHERQGLMREGLQLVLQQAFSVLKLKRVEASVQSANVASLALMQSCGFTKAELSPRHLKISGRWQDHERWAIVA